MADELNPRLASIVTILGERSPKWPALRAAFLVNRKCECCGRRTNLNAHHIKPYHLFPSLELDVSNLLALCEGGPWNCHFLIGHAGKSWKWYHPDPWAAIREARAFLKSMRTNAVR